ncbi:MAG TPA: TolC family protein [Sandaracinaceae bacterium LLY-WYZ-13_1]|nr:TolC family protein [Sandaracinaceae bacterium LLY-WYZ-13_1]
MVTPRASGIAFAIVLFAAPLARAQTDRDPPDPVAEADPEDAVASPEAAARSVLEDEPEDVVPEWMTPTPGGLTAEQAARLAAETAPAVRGAEAQRTAARAQADVAASAFAPQVTITGSYNRINEVDLPPFEFGGMAFDNPFPQILDLWALRGEIQIPVSDYFLTVWPSYEGADGFARAAGHQVEVQRQDAAFRAREAFYNHVRALAGRWVAEQAVESLDATLRDVESLQEAGVGSRADVAQVRAQRASARAMVVQAQGQVRVTERLLRRLLHLPRGARIEVGEDLFGVEVGAPPSEDALLEQAMAERSEVLAVRTLVEARESMVRARLGSVFPHVAIIGQIETSSPNQRIIPQTTDFFTTWVVGAAVSWSPNDVAVGVHRIREAEAQVSEAREDLEQLEDGLAIEVAQAVAAHQAAAESIAAAREGLEAADTALSDRRAMLTAGMATTTEVMQAQLEHTRARLELLNAYVDLHVARAQIDRIAGRAAPDASE